jgi:Ca2+-binding RTX toxin-like protein
MRNTVTAVVLAVICLAPVQAAYAQPKCAGLVATIVGTPSSDLIFGTPGPDVIQGLGGDDDIRGLGGNDIICGGPGNDVIRGGPGNDLLIGGPGDDTIFGQRGNDTIRGNKGNDNLNGNKGNDTVNGNAGIDTCNGGPGSNNLISCNEQSPPPPSCQSPPLNTNFSNLGIFFLDSVHQILMGLTSDGSNVAIVLTDISGALVGALGFPTSGTQCIIDAGIADLDGDGSLSDEFLLSASGNCILQLSRTQLALNNFVLLGVPLGINVVGQCTDVAVLNAVTGRGEPSSVDDMTEALSQAMFLEQLDIAEERADEGESDVDDGTGIIEDFKRELEQQP